VAFAANIVTIDAAVLARLLLMADCTLHHFVFREVFQLCFADQTFFMHILHLYLLFCGQKQ